MILILVLISVVQILAQNACELDRLESVKQGRMPIRGANLGSWFVLESWMATKPWDENNCDRWQAYGNWQLEQCLGNRKQDVLERHWSSWITENDFIEMSQRGVNTVRIPVGWWHIYDPQGGVANADLHWNVTPRDYQAGGLKYLDQAMEWALKHGMAVIIDMHAAPGSQNGNDHSSPQWQGQIDWDKSQDNVGQTIDSMGLYADRYGNHSALAGFAVLNEPVVVDIPTLQDYYKRVYDRIRQSSPNSYIIIAGLTGPWESGSEDHWTNFMNPDQGYDKVAMDLHFYSCYGGDPDQSDPNAAIDYIRTGRRATIDEFRSKNPKLLMIGEWSLCGHFDISNSKDFATAQVEVYGTTSLGWTFWTWSPLGPPNDVWSLKTSFDNGWIEPQFPC